MWNRAFILFAAASVLSGCAVSRKLSQVGLREPSSIRENATISAPRQKVISAKAVPAGCPGEVRKQFLILANERVNFPDCPEKLGPSFEASMQFLKMEERSTLEEVVNSHCHSLGIGEFGDSLEELVANFETTGPIGRRSGLKETLIASDGEAKSLLALKESLDEIVDLQLPLERWGRRYGSFVLPDEDLNFLGKLVLDRACELGDEEVDLAYRTIRSMEDLTRILRAGEQRDRVEQFLLGVHKTIDRRIQEFFPK